MDESTSLLHSKFESSSQSSRNQLLLMVLEVFSHIVALKDLFFAKIFALMLSAY